MRAGIAPSWFQNPEEPPVPPGRKAWQDGGRRTFLGRLGPPAARGPGARSAMLGEGREAASRALAAPGSPTGDTRVTGEGALVCWGGGGGARKLTTWRLGGRGCC